MLVTEQNYPNIHKAFMLLDSTKSFDVVEYYQEYLQWTEHVLSDLNKIGGFKKFCLGEGGVRKPIKRHPMSSDDAVMLLDAWGNVSYKPGSSLEKYYEIFQIVWDTLHESEDEDIQAYVNLCGEI